MCVCVCVCVFVCFFLFFLFVVVCALMHARARVCVCVYSVTFALRFRKYTISSKKFFIMKIKLLFIHSSIFIIHCLLSHQRNMLSDI